MTITWKKKKTMCRGVGTAVSIVVCGGVRVPVARVNLRTQESQRGCTVYPDSGRSVPYVWQLMILILKSTQNMWVTTECKGVRERFDRERFDRGSFGADPRAASPPVEPSPSPERRKITGAVKELLVSLSGLLCSRCRA
jgi:hypothetical protein